MLSVRNLSFDKDHGITVQDDNPLRPFLCLRPEVKILFYTDYYGVTLGNDDSFGVDILKDLIEGQSTFFSKFTIDLLDRHSGGHAQNKLTANLLDDYDEVWFFGVLQANVTDAMQNELTDDEVGVLENWMKDGGVLMTGDHANTKPFNASSQLDNYVNLGRALGYRVPRAGELRRWEGAPTANASDSYNTQYPQPPTSIDSLTLQSDENPQQLKLKEYPVFSLYPFVTQTRPHPLFCGKDGRIEIFPDHAHEGHLTIPRSLGTAWPVADSGYQPKPEVVAWGRDKRTGDKIRIVTAYDGNPAKVGRIIADSTWHHYFNINLEGFPVNADGTPGVHLAKIGEFFVNAAVWLAPKKKRKQMTCSLLWQAIMNPQLQEVRGIGPFYLGNKALDVLGRRVNRCLVEELIRVVLPDEPLQEWPRLPDPLGPIVFGSILAQYFDAANERLANPKTPVPRLDGLIEKGIERGVGEMQRALAETQKQWHALERVAVFDNSK